MRAKTFKAVGYAFGLGVGGSVCVLLIAMGLFGVHIETWSEWSAGIAGAAGAIAGILGAITGLRLALRGAAV